MEVTLVRFKNEDEQRHFLVRGGRCLIGRQKTCDLPIPLSSVSREHCEVVIEGESARVRDLGSRNGTFRNGEKITEMVTLEPGDRIAIGPIVFTVQINGEPEYVEPPLLEAPTASTAQAASEADVPEGDDNNDDLSGLLAEIDSDDSSVFDLDLYLDDEE